MRVEIGGAQITSAVVEVIESLQTSPDLLQGYVLAIDEATRMQILEGEDPDGIAMERLRRLQQLRCDLITIAMPPDESDEANDIPAAQL